MDGDKLRQPVNKNCYAVARFTSFAHITVWIVAKCAPYPPL